MPVLNPDEIQVQIPETLILFLNHLIKSKWNYSNNSSVVSQSEMTATFAKALGGLAKSEIDKLAYVKNIIILFSENGWNIESNITEDDVYYIFTKQEAKAKDKFEVVTPNPKLSFFNYEEDLQLVMITSFFFENIVSRDSYIRSHMNVFGEKPGSIDNHSFFVIIASKKGTPIKDIFEFYKSKIVGFDTHFEVSLVQRKNVLKFTA